MMFILKSCGTIHTRGTRRYNGLSGYYRSKLILIRIVQFIKDFKWTPQDGLISCEKCPNQKIKVNGPQMYRYKLKDGCDAETMIKRMYLKNNSDKALEPTAPPFYCRLNDISISLLKYSSLKAVNWSIDE